MSKQKSTWVCTECGHSQIKWSGSCSVCKNWNTFKEELLEHLDSSLVDNEIASKPISMQDVVIQDVKRINSTLKEFDRVVGGGIVGGTLALVAGDPGVGKSTLMLHLADSLANENRKVLYICGEESVDQVSIRASRLNINNKNIFLLNETSLANIKVHIDSLNPAIIIVDSIQVMYKNEIPSMPGSIIQVREIALEFMKLAKSRSTVVFLIGHITKSGDIAGPKILEHLVDLVLDFSGDRQQGYRLLKSIKNRFGSTDEVAIFKMANSGLKEVENPSLLFLQEREAGATGSVVVPTVEGSRAILVELQALVARSSFAAPSRRSAGVDPNRLTMILAVLEKRMNFALYNRDIFVSTVGGIKIVEPALDLGVLLAISSSFSNKPFDPQTVIFGEVGLGGEIRSVSHVQKRIKEAISLGFKRCVLPKKNASEIGQEFEGEIKIQGLSSIEELSHL